LGENASEKGLNYKTLVLDFDGGYIFGNFTAGVFGTFALNTADLEKLGENNKDEKKAILGGIKFGTKKVSAPGDFEIRAMYRKLEAYAWLPMFSETDAFGGKSNVKGFNLNSKAALYENFFAGINFYMFEVANTKLTQNTNIVEKLFQFDVSYKF